jgi:hypothetical protein
MNTDLRGADLRGVELPSGWPIDFHGARYDALTRWPKGFDPQRHGAIMTR